ncbi:unnamed protein product [Phytomonas sp. EM1]|nr:unnamed protein product [Phytomonas sp. EM1]|eukprot:CCW60958.1 unnamed protein product [Phytomonas sp. isolate EM1]
MYIIWRKELPLFENAKSILNKYSLNNKLFNELREDKRKQKIFLFFLLTILVMFLELAYGTSVNSLGLISDAFHMLIDSMSIAVGFLTAYASSWPPDAKTHSFGYSRYEVLGGFINGILLLLISTHVMIESIQRFIDPPEINASHMFSFSIIGLLVNIIGVIFFHDFHAHSHSHDSDSCCSKQVDCNMRSVFLHILADLLGSVSVIASSIFVHLFNIWIADPICSIFSAIFIFISAIPLLIDTGKILLLSGHDSHQNFCEVLRQRIYATSLLSDVSLPKLWIHSTSPHGLLVCLVDAKLKNTENYSSVKHSLQYLIEETVSENFEINKANIILHLE